MDTYENSYHLRSVACQIRLICANQVDQIWYTLPFAVVVEGDAERFPQMLLNLLDTALRHALYESRSRRAILH